MPEPNPTMRRRQLGMELRRLRDQAELHIDAVAPELHASTSTLSRIERGLTRIKVNQVRRLLDLYELTDEDERNALLQLASAAREPGWWADYGGVLPSRFLTYVGLEYGAARLRTYTLGAVDGLLQTRPYAEAMTRAARPNEPAEAVDKLVGFRGRRQEVLATREPPLTLRTVLDESTLRRPIGGPDVMAGQLQRLLDASAMPNVTVQVLPFGAGAHAGLLGDFTIIEFDDDAPVGYTEGPTGSAFDETERGVSRLIELFALVEDLALSVEDTTQLIRSITEEY